MNSENPVIVWFRRDLRVSDNPALCAAAATGAPVLPVFVLDNEGPLAPGGAARWWLHGSLERLSASLAALGLPLLLLRGDPLAIVASLAHRVNARAVHWNRRYDHAGMAVDTALKAALKADDREAASHNGALLREPWELQNKSGGSFKVFSPFWRELLRVGPSRAAPLAKPGPMRPVPGLEGENLADWRLRPTRPNWAAGFSGLWEPGEAGARARLDAFLAGPVATYSEDRNRPDRIGTSRLSPHLAFGEISPVQIWALATHARDRGAAPAREVDKFLSEIGWREFSHVLLYNNPALATTPIRPEFEAFPWIEDTSMLQCWQRGQTGIPVVDAGMRELWRTGWMHNRVRMIVASFLVKNALIPWQSGERWFWDTLLDADPANNAASWQWVAGCGADAAPYFRIFNPVSQAQKFDPDGAYVRQFVPELSRLPAACIHAPWTAPAKELAMHGVVLGETYPEPALDLMHTRARALEAFASIKKT